MTSSLVRGGLILALAAILGVAGMPGLAQTSTPQPKYEPTPQPIACVPDRLVGLNAGQTESLGYWVRGQGQAAPVKVAFSCKPDRTRIIVGLSRTVDDADKDPDGPPKNTIHVLDLSLDPPPAHLLHSNAVDEPVVIVRPGGALSLVFGETVVEKGTRFRAFRAIDLTSGKTQTLLSLPTGAGGATCGTIRTLGADRLLVAVAATLVDVGDNGPYGLSIEHEGIDCKSGRKDKRTDTFVAVTGGFELVK